jgi:hypothetical protein
MENWGSGLPGGRFLLETLHYTNTPLSQHSNTQTFHTHRYLKIKKPKNLRPEHKKTKKEKR